MRSTTLVAASLTHRTLSSSMRLSPTIMALLPTAREMYASIFAQLSHPDKSGLLVRRRGVQECCKHRARELHRDGVHMHVIPPTAAHPATGAPPAKLPEPSPRVRA